MPIKPLKPLQDVLNDGASQLPRLIAQAERLQRASQVLRAHLEAPLSEHCRVANIKDGSVVMHADSPAWAAKLRFHVAGMLERLNKEKSFGALRAIRIKVSPISEMLPVAMPERLTVSGQAASVLKGAAQATDDAGLKAVLLRLAQRRNKN